MSRYDEQGLGFPAARTPRVVPIRCAGILARDFFVRAPPSGVAAAVVAVFERSLYLRVGELFFCVGAAGIGNGPLTLIADWGAVAGVRKAQGLRPDAAARLSPRGILIDDVAAFAFDGCAVWRAPAWPRATSRAKLDAAYELLARQSAADAPGGLAPVAFGALVPVTSFTRAAAAAAFRFRSWLGIARECDSKLEYAPATSSGDAPVRGLVGLGPGLTPSGDDFLCGALAMLDGLGLHAIHAALARAVSAAAPALTSPLAACLLRAAAAGHVGERLHDIVSALLVGDAAAAAAAARRIGHSSGWDMLAGAATVARTLESP